MTSEKAFQLDWFQNHSVFMTGLRKTVVTAPTHTPLWTGGRDKRCKSIKDTSVAMCHVLAMVGL